MARPTDPHEVRVEVGRRLAELRAWTGLTQKEIGAKIGVDAQSISKLERGEHALSLPTVRSFARAFGEMTNLLRQPVAGRSRAGALRFGNMELDAMLSHGASRFLKERLCEKSDMFAVSICRRCGTIISNECKGCKSRDGVRVVLPYAAKQLFQQLMAMNIKILFSSK